MTYGQSITGTIELTDEAKVLISKYRDSITKLVDEFIKDYEQINSEAADPPSIKNQEKQEEVWNGLRLMTKSAEKAVDHLESASMYIVKSIANGSNISRTLITSTSQSKE